MEKSKTIDAIVKLYDSMDNILAVDSNDLRSYELREEVSNNKILNVKLGQQENLNFGEIRWEGETNFGQRAIIFDAVNVTVLFVDTS